MEVAAKGDLDPGPYHNDQGQPGEHRIAKRENVASRRGSEAFERRVEESLVVTDLVVGNIRRDARVNLNLHGRLLLPASIQGRDAEQQAVLHTGPAGLNPGDLFIQEDLRFLLGQHLPGQGLPPGDLLFVGFCRFLRRLERHELSHRRRQIALGDHP